MKPVDGVMITGHSPDPTNMSVGAELESFRLDIFANGDDRKPEDVDIPPRKQQVAHKLGIALVFTVGQGGSCRAAASSSGGTAWRRDHSRRAR